MLDQLGDEIMVVCSDGRIAFVNQVALERLGYTRKYVLSKNVSFFLKGQMNLARWRQHYFAKLKRTRASMSFVVDRQVKGKKDQVVEVTARYVALDNGGVVVLTGRDITKKMRMEVLLKDSEHLYRLLSDQVAVGIFVVDLPGNIVYANKAIKDIFKVAPAKAVNTHFSAYIDKDSLYKVLGYFRKAKKGVATESINTNLTDHVGRRLPAELAISPIYKDGKVFRIHALVRDMSRRQEMDALLRESEKMKAMRHFIYGTTQEIQYPLKGLWQRTQTLLDKYEQRDFEYIGFKEFKDIMRMLGAMRDQIKYCYDTVDRLLTLNRRKARIEQGFSDVNAVIRGAIKSLKHTLEISDIKVSLKLTSQVPPVEVGDVDLNQIMLNVLTNAIQAIPGRGVVKVKTDFHKAEDRVCIECQDDGIGIDQEDLTRVFDPFFTTKHRGLEKNSGLGLSIVYAIVKSYQGDIFIKSNLRRGTTVRILLPVHAG